MSNNSDDGNKLYYDPQKDAELNKFFNRGNKLKTLEIILIVFSVLIFAAVIGLGIHFYLKEKIIFDTYKRTEGPPGTVSGESTRHLIT
jgi:hypothetical protein